MEIPYLKFLLIHFEKRKRFILKQLHESIFPKYHIFSVFMKYFINTISIIIFMI